MTDDLSSVRWLITGRVQGVGFRWFVLRQAESLGIKGWAQNLADGRVEVVGIAAREAIKAFELALRRGPVMARVDQLQREDFPHEVGQFKSFDIR
jgi:acylphosphatase